MATISENLQILKNSIASIKQAIINKCGNVEGNITTYADYINNINTNTGDNQSPKPASISDVNFLNYDGTILYSYTKEQFLALFAMPELPTREGLICQGWNWDLNDAKDYVAAYGMLNIGTMYITDDGDTRLYIRIASEGRMKVPLSWSQTVTNGVGIDWGDGSDIEFFSGTGNKNTTHTYANPGDYVIRLKVADDCTLGLGNSSSYYCIMGSTSMNNVVYWNMLQKVECGARITNINNYVFKGCYSLASVSMPNSVTSIGDYAFQNCLSLAFVSIPNSVTRIGNYAFYQCHSLALVSMPNSVTNIGSYAFYQCDSLVSFSTPNSVTNIGSYAFGNCLSLASASIPNSVTNIGSYAFQNCQSLASISIPGSVTGIDSYTFSACYGMAIYDFTNYTSVPTLANTNAFSSIQSDCVIKVPASLLDEWKATTNWSTYASKIIAG